MQTKATIPALALLLSLSPLTVGCGKGGAGAIVPDAFIDADFSGWDPAPPPRIRVTTLLLAFGTVDVGSSIAAQDVYVNVFGGPLTLNPTVAGPGFALTATTCSGPVTDHVCKLSLTFSPATIGAASGVLTVDAVGNVQGPAVIALSGVGIFDRGPFPGFGETVELGTLLVNQEAPAVVYLAPTRPAETLACTSSSPDLALVSQTCPTSGEIEAPCTFTFAFKAATAGDKRDAIICAGGGITLQKVVVATVVALTHTDAGFGGTLDGNTLDTEGTGL